MEDTQLPDSAFARFKGGRDGLGYVGVMINQGPRLRLDFIFSNEALQEYAKVTPDFKWHLYEHDPDANREIERTDPKMIDIVHRLGSEASAEGCNIIVKLVPWKLRHDFAIVDHGGHYFFEVVGIRGCKTLPLPK